MRHWIMILIAALAMPAFAAETPEEPGVLLTIYNSNFATIRDRRFIDLEEGLGTVRFRDVAATIDPTSVYFQSLTDPEGTSIQEQNYEFDLVNADKLLEKYIDRAIGVLTKDGSLYEGTLVSFGAGQIVLQDTNGALNMIERGENIKTIQFPSLPGGLLTKPTLVWLVQAAKGGRHLAKLAYRAHDINWVADYTAVTNAGETKVDLSGWVTITNNSGTAYKDARIKLLAGMVTWRGGALGWGPDYFKGLSVLPPTGEKGADPGEVFGEHHLYRLPLPSTINDRQVKQIELINAPDVDVKKVYLYDGAQVSWSPAGRMEHRGFGAQTNKKVNVILEIENRKANGLGFTLPAGRFRIFKRDDADKSLEFIGEDRIAHTPRDERIALYIGDAFDIVGERKQTGFRKVTKTVVEEEFEIKLRNHKEEDVTVKVLEKLYRWSEWEILQKTQDFAQLDSRTISFDVDVPKDAERIITYRVRYSW